MVVLCDLRNSEPSILHNRPLCKSLTLRGMKKPESPRRARRRAKLISLLDEFGGPAQVARETGTPKSHLSAMASGSRGLGDELAAKLEGIYTKGDGWFDKDDDGAKTAADQRPVQLQVSTSLWCPQALQAAVLVNMLKTDVERELVLEMINRVVLARNLHPQS